MARPSKVTAERPGNEIVLLLFWLADVDRPTASNANGAQELKHASDLKKTKLCLEFLEGCCLKSAACPFARCYEDLRVTVSVKDPTMLFLRTRILQKMVCGADTRMVPGSCDAHSPPLYIPRFRNLESIDPFS